jgi:integrase
MNELLVSLEKGVPIPRGRLTVAQHLDQWLEGYVKTNCGPRTFEGYQSIIRNHLAPALGGLQLKELQPAVIQRYYGKACHGLSARTVHHHHRVLSQSLKYAVRQGYLGRNPAEMVDPPTARKKTMRTMTPAEVGILFESAEGNLYYPVFYTALNTGLRQAELLGLRWRDVDLDMCAISVSQVLYTRGGAPEFKEPKTEHSRRRVNMTPKLALYLASYWAEREAFHLVVGKPLTLDDLVFVTPEGRPINPSVLSHNFTKAVKEAGLEHIRFHDLRHTFASLMLMRGAKPKVISEALGHSSVAFTMDVYSHIIDGMQQDAMALLDEVIPAGVPGRNNANLTPTFQS